jgi:type IV pilus assembly protein PilB
LFFDIPEDAKVAFSHGTGCQNCRETGFSGRIAFHELLLVDDQMRSMISTGAGQHQLLKYATQLGYRSLRYDGLKKVLLGLTTIEEIEKHTVLEWDPKIAEDIEL